MQRGVERGRSPERVIHVEIQKAQLEALYFSRSGAKPQKMHEKVTAQPKKLLLCRLPGAGGASIQTRL